MLTQYRYDTVPFYETACIRELEYLCVMMTWPQKACGCNHRSAVRYQQLLVTVVLCDTPSTSFAPSHLVPTFFIRVVAIEDAHCLFRPAPARSAPLRAGPLRLTPSHNAQLAATFQTDRLGFVSTCIVRNFGSK